MASQLSKSPTKLSNFNQQEGVIQQINKLNSLFPQESINRLHYQTNKNSGNPILQVEISRKGVDNNEQVNTLLRQFQANQQQFTTNSQPLSGKQQKLDSKVVYLKNSLPIHQTRPEKVVVNKNQFDNNTNPANNTAEAGGVLSSGNNRIVTKRKSDQIVNKNAIKFNGSPMRNRGFQWMLPFGNITANNLMAILTATTMRINPDANINSLALNGKAIASDNYSTANLARSNQSKSTVTSPKGTRPSSANIRNFAPVSVTTHNTNVLTLRKTQLMKQRNSIAQSQYDVIPHSATKSMTKMESLYFPLESAILEKQNQISITGLDMQKTRSSFMTKQLNINQNTNATLLNQKKVIKNKEITINEKSATELLAVQVQRSKEAQLRQVISSAWELDVMNDPSNENGDFSNIHGQDIFRRSLDGQRMFHQEQLPNYAKKVASTNPSVHPPLTSHYLPSMSSDQSASKLTVQQTTYVNNVRSTGVLNSFTPAPLQQEPPPLHQNSYQQQMNLDIQPYIDESIQEYPLVGTPLLMEPKLDFTKHKKRIMSANISKKSKRQTLKISGQVDLDDYDETDMLTYGIYYGYGQQSNKINKDEPNSDNDCNARNTPIPQAQTDLQPQRNHRKLRSIRGTNSQDICAQNKKRPTSAVPIKKLTSCLSISSSTNQIPHDNIQIDRAQIALDSTFNHHGRDLRNMKSSTFGESQSKLATKKILRHKSSRKGSKRK